MMQKVILRDQRRLSQVMRKSLIRTVFLCTGLNWRMSCGNIEACNKVLVAEINETLQAHIRGSIR